MKARNSLSKSRVYAIAILIFAINFLPELISITANDVMPSLTQYCHSFFLGVLQVAVTLYALLERDEKQELRHAEEEAEAKKDG